MRPEQRGRVKQPHHGFNWRQEEIRDWGKAFHHPEKAGVRGLQGRQGQRGLCRRGPRDDRRLRKELERQSVPDLEPDVVGKLLPAACQGGGHSEEEWRGKDSRRPNRGGSRGAWSSKQSLNQFWNPSSCRTLMGTGRGNRRWTPLLLRAIAAGGMIGFWNSTSKGCSTTSPTIFCYGRLTHPQKSRRLRENPQLCLQHPALQPIRHHPPRPLRRRPRRPQIPILNELLDRALNSPDRHPPPCPNGA